MAPPVLMCTSVLTLAVALAAVGVEARPAEASAAAHVHTHAHPRVHTHARERGSGARANVHRNVVGTGSSYSNSWAGVRGVNYVPSYSQNPVSTWMDYDAAVIERELGFAHNTGFNVVRVFLHVVACIPNRLLCSPLPGNMMTS